MDPTSDTSQDTAQSVNPSNFGRILRQRREEAQLSLTALSKAAGLARATIVNVEHGLTTASPATIRRLAAVKALRLNEITGNAAPKAEAWFCEAYNPMALNHAMVRALNGPGGQIEQTFLYLDPQSACDWFALCNDEQYVNSIRSKAPLDKVAERITKEARGAGIDVNGLGCGDGKTETELMLRLSDLAPSIPPDLQLYLLDISHVLLSEAYRIALNALAPKRISVIGVHGDFNQIAANPMLYLHPESVRRVRVHLMMGYTLGNIRDELWFFRDLAACAQRGDLAVLDFQLARAPADRPDLIRALDAPVGAKKPAENYHQFLAGPLYRHTRGVRSVKLRTELTTTCPVPGSYAIETWATVEKELEPDRHFSMLRVKRYEQDKLSQFLSTIGWNTLQAWKYGPDKLSAVLLIQRQ